MPATGRTTGSTGSTCSGPSSTTARASSLLCCVSSPRSHASLTYGRLRALCRLVRWHRVILRPDERLCYQALTQWLATQLREPINSDGGVGRLLNTLQHFRNVDRVQDSVFQKGAYVRGRCLLLALLHALRPSQVFCLVQFSLSLVRCRRVPAQHRQLLGAAAVPLHRPAREHGCVFDLLTT